MDVVGAYFSFEAVGGVQSCLVFPHITVWGSRFSLASRRGFRRLRRRLALRRLLFTHSTLIHSLTHTSHSLSHSLARSLAHSLTQSLTHSLTHIQAAANLLVAGALPCSWQAQYIEPAGAAAAPQCIELPGCLLRGKRGTQSVLEELRRAWPPLGPRPPFSWQAQYIELPGCLSRGRRGTQSLLEELRRAWPPLGSGCLSPGRLNTQSLRISLLRGRRGTQSFLEELRRGGRRWPAAAFAWHAHYTEPPHFPFAWKCAVHRAFLARAVRRTFALPFRVAGAVHRAFWRSCGTVAAAGPRRRFAWQAQYTEPPHFPFWSTHFTWIPPLPLLPPPL